MKKSSHRNRANAARKAASPNPEGAPVSRFAEKRRKQYAPDEIKEPHS